MSAKTDTIAERKDDIIREIITTGVLEAPWMPLPAEFHSGDEIGFDISGTRVRALVTFDKYEVTVRMTSPVETFCSREVYCRRQTFFRRNMSGSSLFVDDVEGGHATGKCLDKARELLVGLYSDWAILRIRREEIHRKLAGFAGFEREFLEKETERLATLKRRILELSRLSGELKRRFRNGKMSQKEYIESRRPIHVEIVALLDASRPKDPFRVVFADELEECRFALNKQSLIRSV